MNNKIKISYENYLKAPVLGSILEQLQRTLKFNLSKEFKLKRYKCDYIIETTDYVYLIEFDGFMHYNNATQVKRDFIKNLEFIEYANNSNKNYWIIRIPYFVQLNQESFNFLFKKLIEEYSHYEISIYTGYKHGFIDKSALLPSCYCELGVQRFIHELELLPINITNEIILSLIDKTVKKAVVDVLPHSLLEHDLFKNRVEIDDISKWILK